MEQSFDFERIGKKMPYTVPEGYFERMEEDVMLAMTSTASSQVRKKSIRWKRIGRIVGALAAVALLVLVVRTVRLNKENAKVGFGQVELAFNNLSADDQAFLLEVYEEEALEEEEWLLNY